MTHRILRPLRRPLSPARTRRRAVAGLAALGILLATSPAYADRHGGGGHGFEHHGGFHHGGGRGFEHHGFEHHGFRHHFHSFLFFGGGYPFYPGYYPAYPAYYPPPVYVSPTDCYNTVPRAPGVADLYTCAGQYVGPIAVP